MKIGWLSTGRDQAASNLLSDIVARAQQDGVELDIAAVFCDRERGERRPRATASSTWSSASTSRP